MELTQADIQEFKALYEAEFGEQTEWSDAERMATDLAGLYEAVWEAMLNEADCQSDHS